MMVKCSYTYLISSLALLLLHLFPAKCEKPIAPALYVFGDSLVDSGNNNFLATYAKANYAPYGIDFPSGLTGRFTNGKTGADFLAQKLGLPVVPPYVGLSEAQKRKTLTGVNYASGSAGILRETGLALGKNLCMKEQVKMFKKTVHSYLSKNFKTQEDLSRYLSKAIFLVCIGSNDYLNNYLQPEVGIYNSSRRYRPEQFGGLLVHRLKKYLTDLYNFGARKFIVYGIGPIGCIPAIVNKQKLISTGAKDEDDQFRSQIDNTGLHGTLQELISTLKTSSLAGKDKLTTCSENINQWVTYFNGGLNVILQELNAKLQDSTFAHIEVYGLSYDTIQNPSKYGFTQRGPCCVCGGNGTSLCLKDEIPCGDRSKYLYWDGFHPTEQVNSIFADRCFSFSGHSPCSAANINHLVQK